MASAVQQPEALPIEVSSDAPQHGRRWAVPALLIALYVAQCLWFVSSQSFTYDEPLHLYTGLRAWHGRFDMWNENPPLARLLLTFPLLATHGGLQWSMTKAGPQVTQFRPGPTSVAWLTRPLNVMLGVLLALMLWTTAARIFSTAAANFVLALFALSPGMIAQFSVATVDGIGILAVFTAAVAVAYWRQSPTLRNTILLGAATGLLLLSKFYTLPLAAVVLALVFTRRADGGFVWRLRLWNWRQGTGVAVIALVLVWAAYGFSVTRVRVRDYALTAEIPGTGSTFVSSFPLPLNFTVWLPAGEYADGIRAVADHNRVGHANYLFGQVSRRGWIYYAPVIAFLKWPVIVLALFLISAALMARRRIPVPREFLVIAAFPVLFAFICVGSHIQIGDRHLLPIYPFLLLPVAGLWCWARRTRYGAVVLLALLAVQAADTARVAPDWLSYFNIGIRNQEAYKLVSDSNLDWGEGLIALRRWQLRHPGPPLHFAYRGSVDPALYGIAYQPLAPGQRVTGAVAVSMSNIAGEYLTEASSYRWLLKYPRESVNHSIFIFHVPPTY